MVKPELQKYGCPIYGVAWANGYAFMCGGGNLGIENKVVVVRSENGRLSDEVAKLNVGKDAPYRMAMHPSGRAMVLGLTLGGVVRISITPGAQPDKPPTMALFQQKNDDDKADEKRFKAIKSMSFTEDGKQLALGGEDGSLEIVAWPSLERIIKWQASENNKALRNVDYSGAHSDGIIFSVDESGACKAWDTTSGELVTQLQPPASLPRATFFRCKSVVDDEGIALYAALKFKGNGYVLRYRQGDDGQITLDAATNSKQAYKPLTPAPICGFEASHSGRLLAAVTPDGDACIVSTESLQTVKYNKGAHMTFATAVAFKEDDSAILSTSADASATLTTIGKGSYGASASGTVLAILAVVLAVIAVFMGLLRYYAVNVVQQEDALSRFVQWLPVVLQDILAKKA